MPFDALTSRTDAAALMPEDVSRDIIRSAPKASIALSLMKRVNMSRKQQRMPVLSALAQAYWVSGDTGLKQTTKEAWANKFLVAEELATIVPIPNAVLDDSDYPLWDEVKPDCIEAAGALIDAAALFGVGRPTTWPTSLVEGATAAGNQVVRGATAGRDIAGDLNATMRMVAADGHPVNGIASDSLLEYDVQDQRDSQGRPIFSTSLTDGVQRRALYGRPFQFLDTGSWDASEADAITGDWTQAIIGVRQDITFTVHTEGVITDDAGAVVLNLMQQDSAALRMVMRVGFQVANPVSRRTAAADPATRYPFSVLRPAGWTP